MVLGKLPVPGHPTIWMIVGQGPIVLAVGVGGGCLDILTLIYLFSFLSPSLWKMAQYRLKYCQRVVKPKTTNQPNQGLLALQIFFLTDYSDFLKEKEECSQTEEKIGIHLQSSR